MGRECLQAKKMGPPLLSTSTGNPQVPKGVVLMSGRDKKEKARQLLDAPQGFGSDSTLLVGFP